MTEYEEMMSWVRENYPMMLDNPELASALYRARVKNEKAVILNLYPYRKISDLEPEKVSMIVGIVASPVDFRTYKYCHRCNSSHCIILDHEKEEKHITTLTLVDETSSIACTNFDLTEKNADEMKKADSLFLTGRLHTNTFGTNFVFSSYSTFSKEEIIAFYDVGKHLALNNATSISGEDEIGFQRFLDSSSDLVRKMAGYYSLRRSEGRIWVV